ncbi:MAG: HAD family hydrolase [Gemmatimonadaceae bacterium]
MTPHRGAVFLDRDGTIIRDVHYIADPGDVELLPGVSTAIERVNSAGVPVIVITNQSGIARGMFTVSDYEQVAARVDQLLSVADAHLDATYYCPHGPDDGCECRKPGTLLYRNAAAEYDIDLAASLYIGDRLRDIEPAFSLGGHGVLIPAVGTSASEVATASVRGRVAASLGAAIDDFLADD